MFKKLIITIFILLILGAGALFYLNEIFLPTTFHDIAIEKLQGALHRPVSIDFFRFSFREGLVAHHIVVFQKDLLPSPFINIKKASIKFYFIPFLKEKKVIIPSLQIAGPIIQIARFEENLWNFSDLIQQEPKNAQQAGLSVWVKKISVMDGTVLLTDKTLPEDFFQEINGIDLVSALSFDKTARFSFKARSKHLSEVLTLRASGTADIFSKKVTARAILENCSLTHYLRPYSKLKSVDILGGTLENAKLDISWQHGILDVKGKALTKGVALRIAPNKDFSGNPKINFELRFTPAQEQKIFYQGTVEPNGSHLSGLPRIEKLEKIAGEVYFQNDLVKFDQLEAFIADDFFIRAQGKIKDFTSAQAEVNVSSDTDIAQVLSLFPEISEKIRATAEGQASFDLKFAGLVSSPQDAEVSLAAQLDGVQVTAEKIPEPVTNISGLLTYSKDRLFWKNLNFLYQNEHYTSEGTLTGLTAPLLDAKVHSKKLDLQTRIKISENALRVESSSGRIYNSSFSVNGNINLPENQSPHLDLAGTVDLNLQDIENIKPDIKEKLDSLQPAGTVSLQGSLNGSLNDWRQWTIELNGRSRQITLDTYKLGNVDLTYRQRRQFIEQFDLAAGVYGGNFNLTSSADLADDKIPFGAELAVENINLAELKRDTIWTNKNISGTWTANFRGEGLLNDMKALQGKGSVFIKDGHVWEMDLFEGLGKFLFIPEFKDITFHEATGNFNVQNQRVYTDNLTLKSKPVNLLCRGWVDFEGKISFGIFSQFSQETIARSTSLKKMITSFLTRSGDYLTIKLSGTLQKPRYVVIPASIDVFKKTTDFLLESLQSIIE